MAELDAIQIERPGADSAQKIVCPITRFHKECCRLQNRPAGTGSMLIFDDRSRQLSFIDKPRDRVIVRSRHDKLVARSRHGDIEQATILTDVV